MRQPTKTLMKLFGYTRLYPPQEQAIKYGVEDGVSLLVATPTASGKTFIGLTAIVNRLQENEGLAVYTVPLRSIAMEKHDTMKKLERLGYKTSLLIGDMRTRLQGYNIILTTYEKLDSIVRNNPRILESIRVLVVDEIHYINDSKRGIVLEALLTRILSSKNNPQIIALSATVPNAEEIAAWLGATPIIMEWRPVPLKEAVFKDYTLYYPRENTEEKVENRTRKPHLDLALRVSEENGQTIVFSMSRRRTVQLAKQSAQHKGLLKYDRKLAKLYAAKIMSTGGPSTVRELLAKLVEKGVAFHHAGLSNEQRKLVEEAFRKGAISIIHATPTLAAGVNLPARQVVVDEYYRFEAGMRRPIPVFEYKQLSGRAGRPGYDEIGESIILASKTDSVEEIASTYIHGMVEPVKSRLSGLRGLRHILLGLISSVPSIDYESISKFASATLYAKQVGSLSLLSLMERALYQLKEWELIEEQGSKYSATLLGMEVSRTYLDPQTVHIISNILENASSTSEMILLYMIARAPDAVTLSVTKREHEKLLDMILENYQELIDILGWFGLEEARAFKTALLLKYWIDEASEEKIYDELGAGPGDIANIVETSAWISASLSRIVPLLGFKREISEHLSILSMRIKYGVKTELLQLVAIPGIGRVRARRLYNAGYKTLAHLAQARVEDLLKIKGIGASVVKNILEFLGRTEEAKKLAPTRRGIDAFL
jgi:helicase